MVIHDDAIDPGTDPKPELLNQRGVSAPSDRHEVVPHSIGTADQSFSRLRRSRRAQD